MYRPTIVILLVSTLLLFCEITNAGNQQTYEYVPLKPMKDITIEEYNGYVDVAYYQPNGSLSAGNWADYYFDVSNVHSDYGIGIYLVNLTENISYYSIKVRMYLKRGEKASSANYDAYSFINNGCLDSVDGICSSFGKCNPKDGRYYVSIYNQIDYTPFDYSINYQFQIVLTPYVKLNHKCEKLGLSESLWIIIGVCMFITVLIAAGVLACVYCCCRRKRSYSAYQRSFEDQNQLPL